MSTFSIQKQSVKPQPCVIDISESPILFTGRELEAAAELLRHRTNWAGEAGEKSGYFHTTHRVGSGHSITTGAATANENPMVVLYDGRLY